jgi:hypothetical protein
MKAASARRALVERRMVAEINGATRSPVKQRRNPNCIITLGSSVILIEGICLLPNSLVRFSTAYPSSVLKACLGAQTSASILFTTNRSSLRHGFLLSDAGSLACQDLNEIARVRQSFCPFRPFE